MATIDSTRFGVIEVQDELLFTFPRGIPGFEGTERFCVVERNDQAFKWMQSMEVPELAFIIADPYFFFPDYEADIPEGELKLIDYRFPEDLAMAVIVNVPVARPQEMTVNLRAPLVFNVRERLGMQVIQTASKYSVNYAVIQEWQRESEELGEAAVAHLERQRSESQSSGQTASDSYGDETPLLVAEVR